jgi:hypothetical protein
MIQWCLKQKIYLQPLKGKEGSEEGEFSSKCNDHDEDDQCWPLHFKSLTSHKEVGDLHP